MQQNIDLVFSATAHTLGLGDRLGRREGLDGLRGGDRGHCRAWVAFWRGLSEGLGRPTF